jgi:hypothetical protein
MLVGCARRGLNARHDAGRAEQDKQPRMTVAPKRQFIRPVSIMKPTMATAITAAVVATLPINVPCNQEKAPTIAPDPAGSAA